MRGCANVIAKTTVAPMTPPSHIHAGVRNAPPRPPTPVRATTRIASESASCTQVENVSASRVPMRPPKRPITATCTEPASPASTVSATPADSTVDVGGRHLDVDDLAGHTRYAPLVIRVVVLYGEAPDSQEYEAHAELCRLVPGATFRHGAVFGAPMGEPAHGYFAEWEFPDEESFKAGAARDEVMATGKDADKRGLPVPSGEVVRVL